MGLYSPGERPKNDFYPLFLREKGPKVLGKVGGGSKNLPGGERSQEFDPKF